MEFNWSDLLQETRKSRSSSDQQFWLGTIPLHFASVTDQLCLYENVFRRRNFFSDTGHGIKHEKVDTKQIVLSTRLGLRFGLSCMSVLDENIRKHLQQLAVFKFSWHMRLSSFLSRKDLSGGSGGDGKCRLLASQLLSNLVTANRETAGRVFQDLPLAPSSKEISRRLASSCAVSTNLEVTTGNRISEGGDAVAEEARMDEVDHQPCWVDMIIAFQTSNQREVLGIVVAALHNGTASLLLLRTPLESSATENQDESTCITERHWAEEVSSNALLVSMLLRHVLPATSILGNQTGNTSPHAQQQHLNEDRDPHDDVGTEWIGRFLSLLSRLGYFPQLYSSARGDFCGGSTKDNCSDLFSIGFNENISTIVPEQVVLLFCLERALDEFTSAQQRQNSTESSNTPLHEQQHPLGGAGGAGSILLSHRLLGSLARSLRGALPSTWTIITAGAPTPSVATVSSLLRQDQPHLQKAALVSILHILSDSLGIEQPGITTRLRQELAGEPETGLLSSICRDLALLYDHISNRHESDRAQRQQNRLRAQQQPNYHAGSAGAKLHLSSEEQLLLTLFVRCIGNFCFQCRPNQDMMRLTLVPRCAPSSSNIQGEAGSQPAKVRNGDGRTALHVVMSCTSFGVACFTLREWAVVALRSMLQDNERNQELAAQLEAEQPVQTAELDDMGIRVDIDSAGKVSVVPLPAPKDQIPSTPKSQRPVSKDRSNE